VTSGRDHDGEPDRLPGAPHPRERGVLFGHEEAERAFLTAFAAGRLHHAWLIGGPEGVGKATLAYRVARCLLAFGVRPAQTLALNPEHRIARQVSALSHPNLVVLRRPAATDAKAAATTIPVDAVRRAHALFGATAADGGYRVCVVDSADDLTVSSANALLKLIEEPPPRSIFLIVAHAPQRLLPTVRSRCRRLLLRPLADPDLAAAVRSLPDPWGTCPDRDLAAAARMAEGSVRRALLALDGDRMTAVHEARALLDALPRVDLKRVLSLAEILSRRDADETYELVLETLGRWTSEHLNAWADEGPARLAPLVEVCDKVARAAREVETYNLDRRPLIVSMFGDLAEAVRRVT
jgi:DNA polymerase III subunit delta'